MDDVCTMRYVIVWSLIQPVHDLETGLLSTTFNDKAALDALHLGSQYDKQTLLPSYDFTCGHALMIYNAAYSETSGLSPLGGNGPDCLASALRDMGFSVQTKSDMGAEQI